VPGGSIAAVCTSVGSIYRRHGSVCARILAPVNGLYWDRTTRSVAAHRFCMYGLDLWFQSYSSVMSPFKTTIYRGHTLIYVYCPCLLTEKIYDI